MLDSTIFLLMLPFSFVLFFPSFNAVPQGEWIVLADICERYICPGQWRIKHLESLTFLVTVFRAHRFEQ